MRTTRTSPLQTQELTQVILYILLSSETNRLGKTTNYYYNDRGSKVREDFDIYRFSYRDHGELYEVRVNGNVKVTYDYINSGTLKDLLNSVIYNNGDVINYSYDQYGQLTQTADTANGFTESYTYDSRGNILSKTKVYDDENVPAETTNFSYTNSDWQDELTSVNGTPLTYDANGNVLTYGNMEFEWTNGRVLSQITVNLEDPNGTADVYSYTYDESGIRSSKTVNGVTTYFTTKDGVILSQTDGTNTMYFQYDNSGNPTGFIYNGTQYFYLTNQMGDVIGISDNTGSLIATYTYGAWGEVLTVTPATTGNTTQLAIANANPLRYRGYYLDQETGFYYLRTRYYSSQILRFLSVDNYRYLDVDIPVGLNLFTYCENDPNNYKDNTGEYSVPAALKYAEKYWKNYNPEYPKQGNYDCANFVSQCLHAGGWKMTAKWCYLKVKGKKLKVTDAWGTAKGLKTYIQHTKGIKMQLYKTPKALHKAAQQGKIKRGAVMFLIAPRDLNDHNVHYKKGDGTHAMMVDQVYKSWVFYYGHNENRGGKKHSGPVRADAFDDRYIGVFNL